MHVAEVVQRSDGVALARCAAEGTQAVGARLAPVTASPSNVALTVAVATQLVADVAFCPCLVALAS